MKLYYHITEKSSNRKTGDMPVVTSSYKTCSDACPFKDNGCYGDGGPINLHWEKVSRGDKRALTFDELLDKIPKVAEKVKKRNVNRIRLWQVGDMPGLNNRINTKQVRKLIKVLQPFTYAFGYSHKPLTKENCEIINECNDNGVAINLSANNLHHADFLKDLQVGPVSVTLPQESPLKDLKTPNSTPVLICPAVLSDHITCMSCGGNNGPLCWRVNREYIIGFPAHGFRSKNASEVARGTQVRY